MKGVFAVLYASTQYFNITQTDMMKLMGEFQNTSKISESE